MDIKEMMRQVPKKHPFERAELCESYYYDNMPTYVTRPAYDAYTYPVYDSGSRSFLYRHYDMETETADDVSISLTELVEAYIAETVEICSMLKVPEKDIKETLEKLAFK